MSITGSAASCAVSFEQAAASVVAMNERRLVVMTSQTHSATCFHRRRSIH